MVEHSDDDRLTLGQLATWANMMPAELRALEAKGVIHRSDDLFPAGETMSALADNAEAELAALKVGYRLSFKGYVMVVWEAPAKALKRFRRGFEYAVGSLLNRIGARHK
jgi:hypothetical protein